MNRWGVLSAWLLFAASFVGIFTPHAVAGIMLLLAACLGSFISLAVARWRSEQAFTARVARRNERTEA